MMYSGMPIDGFAYMTFCLGHCGSFGIGGVLLTIIVGQLCFTAGQAGLTLSFYTTAGSITPLAAPFLYDFMALVTWVSGAFSIFVGLILMVVRNSKARGPLLNIWIALLILHAAIVIVYGVHMVKRLRDLYMIHYDIYGVISESGLWAAKRVGFEPSKKLEEKVSPGGIAHDMVESVTASIILSVAPYPFNLLFFLGMRSDVAILLYIILPGTFVLFSLPFAFAIRNYFTSTRPGVVEHREPYEGVPLTRFVCSGGLPHRDNEEFAEDEEDLASTFYDSSSDEDDSDYTSDEESSLLSSSSVYNRGQSVEDN